MKININFGCWFYSLRMVGTVRARQFFPSNLFAAIYRSEAGALRRHVIWNCASKLRLTFGSFCCCKEYDILVDFFVFFLNLCDCNDGDSNVRADREIQRGENTIDRNAIIRHNFKWIRRKNAERGFLPLSILLSVVIDSSRLHFSQIMQQFCISIAFSQNIYRIRSINNRLSGKTYN